MDTLNRSLRSTAGLFFALCALHVIAQSPPAPSPPKKSAPKAEAPLVPFPGKPLRIVVPFGPGGVVATTVVAKADPDGHTLLLMSNGSAISAAGLFKSLPFDTVKDFTPVAVLGTFDLVIVVGADSKFKTLADLLAHAKANPDKLNLGTINIGSTQHLAAELFKSTTGAAVQVVPFNGTPAVITALRGGQIDAAIEILGPMLPQIQSSAVRALAVTGEKRAGPLPGVPTVKESGFASYVVSSWNALAAPARTPKETIARLNREVVAILAVPDVVRRLRDLNVDPHPGTPEQAAQLLHGEIKRWAGVIAKARIPAQ